MDSLGLRFHVPARAMAVHRHSQAIRTHATPGLGFDAWLDNAARIDKERLAKQLRELPGQMGQAASQHAALLQELGQQAMAPGMTLGEQKARLAHIAEVAQQRMQQRAIRRSQLDPAVMALRGGLGRMAELAQETQARLREQYQESPEVLRALVEEFREEQAKAMKGEEQSRAMNNTTNQPWAATGPAPNPSTPNSPTTTVTPIAPAMGGEVMPPTQAGVPAGLTAAPSPAVPAGASTAAGAAAPSYAARSTRGPPSSSSFASPLPLQGGPGLNARPQGPGSQQYMGRPSQAPVGAYQAQGQPPQPAYPSPAASDPSPRAAPYSTPGQPLPQQRWAGALGSSQAPATTLASASTSQRQQQQGSTQLQWVNAGSANAGQQPPSPNRNTVPGPWANPGTVVNQLQQGSGGGGTGLPAVPASWQPGAAQAMPQWPTQQSFPGSPVLPATQGPVQAVPWNTLPQEPRGAAPRPAVPATPLPWDGTQSGYPYQYNSPSGSQPQGSYQNDAGALVTGAGRAPATQPLQGRGSPQQVPARGTPMVPQQVPARGTPVVSQQPLNPGPQTPSRSASTPPMPPQARSTTLPTSSAPTLTPTQIPPPTRGTPTPLQQGLPQDPTLNPTAASDSGLQLPSSQELPPGTESEVETPTNQGSAEPALETDWAAMDARACGWTIAQPRPSTWKGWRRDR